tara:strand:+ start:83671 stop:83994 length:324 start_codon:yes stop_codon:yes gene_type:complete
MSMTLSSDHGPGWVSAWFALLSLGVFLRFLHAPQEKPKLAPNGTLKAVKSSGDQACKETRRSKMLIDMSLWYKAKDGNFYPDMETVDRVNEFWFRINFPEKVNKYHA